MQNVLVVTMPNTRKYNISTDLRDNNTVRNTDTSYTLQINKYSHFHQWKWKHQLVCLPLFLQMNDYMAAYHDAVMLVGRVMRDIINKSQLEIEQMEFVNVHYFRNTSFDGKGGGEELVRGK